MIGTLLIAYLKKIMITYALIIANVILFILTIFYFEQIIYGVDNFAGLGFRSIYLNPEYSPQLYTLFTSMFIHGGFLHIFGNMFIFLFLGMAFEQRIGAKKFLIIYLLTGVIGALSHSILDLGSWIPLIGASGAVFGIMGAFAYSYPRDEIVMPIPVGIMFITRIKVMYAVVIFALMETFIVMYEAAGSGPQSNTAHFAHLGGLISGLIIAAIILRRTKTHTKLGQTVYYDSFASQRPEKLNVSGLRKLADTPELKEMLIKIENETVPQVRDVWIEHFLEKAICPKCSNPLNHFSGDVWCEQCGFKTKY
jgi:membrane associated rhomboid family serine protease